MQNKVKIWKNKNKQTKNPKSRQRVILGIPGKQIFLWARLSQSGRKHKITLIHPIIILWKSNKICFVPGSLPFSYRWQRDVVSVRCCCRVPLVNIGIVREIQLWTEGRHKILITISVRLFFSKCFLTVHITLY